MIFTTKWCWSLVQWLYSGSGSTLAVLENTPQSSQTCGLNMWIGGIAIAYRTLTQCPVMKLWGSHSVSEKFHNGNLFASATITPIYSDEEAVIILLITHLTDYLKLSSCSWCAWRSSEVCVGTKNRVVVKGGEGSSALVILPVKLTSSLLRCWKCLSSQSTL